jgi:hypothetical protein
MFWLCLQENVELVVSHNVLSFKYMINSQSPRLLAHSRFGSRRRRRPPSSTRRSNRWRRRRRCGRRCSRWPPRPFQVFCFCRLLSRDIIGVEQGDAELWRMVFGLGSARSAFGRVVGIIQYSSLQNRVFSSLSHSLCVTLRTYIISVTPSCVLWRRAHSHRVRFQFCADADDTTGGDRLCVPGAGRAAAARGRAAHRCASHARQ